VVDGKMEKTPVQVGLANLTTAEITTGLSPSDVIVVRALHGGTLEITLASCITKSEDLPGPDPSEGLLRLCG
jgi:hypothetical protein